MAAPTHGIHSPDMLKTAIRGMSVEEARYRAFDDQANIARVDVDLVDVRGASSQSDVVGSIITRFDISGKKIEYVAEINASSPNHLVHALFNSPLGPDEFFVFAFCNKITDNGCKITLISNRGLIIRYVDACKMRGFRLTNVSRLYFNDRTTHIAIPNNIIVKYQSLISASPANQEYPLFKVFDIEDIRRDLTVLTYFAPDSILREIVSLSESDVSERDRLKKTIDMLYREITAQNKILNKIRENPIEYENCLYCNGRSGKMQECGHTLHIGCFKANQSKCFLCRD